MDLTYNFSLGSSDNGNVIGITNNKDSTRSQAFTYDSLNRILTAETTSTHSTSPANCWSEIYQYDNLTSGGEWGNLTSIGEGPSQYNGCVQESGLSITVNSNNQISTSGFTYDSGGNLIGNGSIVLHYDAENRICSLGGTSCTTGTTYVYDGDGRRVEKTTSGTAYKLYWYDASGNVLDETDGTGSTSNSNFNEYVFFSGKRIAKRNSPTTVDYYFADQLGTSRVVSDAIGDIPPLDDSDFYPYGGERPVTGPSSGNHYKFTGKERDSESGLDNFGARYDSSQYGRFMTPDPLVFNELRLVSPQRWNQYSYSINNPITYSDPDGRDAALVTFGGMVGGLGHDGLLSVHSDGTATYGEFGPTSHSASNLGGAVAPGSVNIDNNLPKVQFGNDGKPTAESLQALKQAIAKNDEGGINPDTVQITYVKTSEAETISLDNYFRERKASADAGKDPYRVYSHNCDNFCQRGLVAGGVTQKTNFSIIPNIFAWQLWMLQNAPTRAQLHELVTSRICSKPDCSDKQ